MTTPHRTICTGIVHSYAELRHYTDLLDRQGYTRLGSPCVDMGRGFLVGVLTGGQYSERHSESRWDPYIHSSLGSLLHTLLPNSWEPYVDGSVIQGDAHAWKIPGGIEI